MDSNDVNLDEPKEFVEPPIEASTGASLCGFYANGPDDYVLSLRRNPMGASAPQGVEDAEPKPNPGGPVCPQCGNAINEEMRFCPECGVRLTRG